MKLSIDFVVIDCPDPQGLADFYSRLFDGAPIISDHNEWGVRWIELDRRHQTCVPRGT